MNSQTRPCHASGEDETRCQGSDRAAESHFRAHSLFRGKSLVRGGSFIRGGSIFHGKSPFRAKLINCQCSQMKSPLGPRPLPYVALAGFRDQGLEFRVCD